jgi:hypothetical protein
MKRLHVKIVVVLLLCVVLLATAVPAFAQDHDLPKPGMTSDHPLYFVKNIVEKARLFFTWDIENKVELLSDLAGRKIAETQILIKKHKPGKVDKTLKKYDEYIEQAEDYVDKGMSKEKDMTKAIEAVEKATAKHTEVLEKVLQEKVPEKAQSAIGHAIEVSKNGNNRALEVLNALQNGENPGKAKGKAKHEESSDENNVENDSENNGSNGDLPLGVPPKKGKNQ